jgi:hypothetical protein
MSDPVCCEGGVLTAGCHHDNCTGPESAEVTITRAEYKLFQRLTKIWFHSSEKSDSFFICGEGGDHDENGLPDIILVCPHHGINTTAIYEKKHVGKSGQ